MWGVWFFSSFQCDSYEIRPGKHLGVCISVANNRLFVGSIPKNKTKENILEEFSKVTEGLVDVILYHQPDDKKKNRGFCFLEYEDHKSAAQARRRLMSGKVKVWGNVVTVEWADPVEEPDPEVMAKVNAVSCVGGAVLIYFLYLEYKLEYLRFCSKYKL